MAKSFVDSYKKFARKLYDGDFIDLTDENESQICVDEDVVLVNDYASENQNDGIILNGNGIDILKKAIHNQTGTGVPVTSVVNAVNAVSNNSQSFLVPISGTSPTKYLIVNQAVNKNALQSAVTNMNNNDKQCNKNMLDQVIGTPSSVGTKINLKNSRGNITANETPHMSSRHTKNVVIQDNIKISPSVQRTATFTAKKGQLNDKSSATLTPVMEATIIQNILKEMAPKTSKAAGKIITIPSKQPDVTKTSPSNIKDMSKVAPANVHQRTSVQFKKIVPKLQNPVPTSQNSKDFDAQDVILMPTVSENKIQKNERLSSNTQQATSNVQKGGASKNTALFNTKLPRNDTVQKYSVKINQINDDVISLATPSSKGPNKTRKTAISKSPLYANTLTVAEKLQKAPSIPTPSTQSKNPSPLTRKNNMLISSNAATKDANTDQTTSKTPLVLPPEKLKLVCDGQYIDLTEKRILYHVDKNGKHGYVILDRKQNVNNSFDQPAPILLNTSPHNDEKTPLNPQKGPTVTVSKEADSETRAAYTVIPANQQSVVVPQKAHAGTGAIKARILMKHNGGLVPTLCSKYSDEPVSSSLRNRWARMNVSIDGTFSPSDTVLFNHHGATVAQVPEHMSVEPKEPMFYMLCPIDDSATATVLPEAVPIAEVVDDVEEAPSGGEEVEEVFENDPLNELSAVEHTTSVIAEPACLVTPVDITKILNEAKKPEVVVTDRCSSALLKKQSLYRKGFSRREMGKPACLKYLHQALVHEEFAINNLKKSVALRETSFVRCDSEPSRFLPETFKSELDDEVTIEYNNIEEQLDAEVYDSATLPVISKVISEVNDEVRQMKKAHQTRSKRSSNVVEEELKAKLAKPEEALKLIKKGLELIQSWSKETHLEKTNKTVTAKKVGCAIDEVKKRRGRAAKVVEKVSKPSPVNKRSIRNTETVNEKEVFSQPTKRKRGRKPQNKEREAVNVKTVVNTTGGRRTRKRKLENFNDPLDNELFVVKKVDILNERRSR